VVAWPTGRVAPTRGSAAGVSGSGGVELHDQVEHRSVSGRAQDKRKDRARME